MTKLVCLLLIISTSFLPVYACLNDSEIQAYEEEFQSEYMNSNGNHTVPDGIADNRDSSMVAIASTGTSILGILLILVLAVKMDIRVHTQNKE